MILEVSELKGKALDWMYERAIAGTYNGMKCEEGLIFIVLNDDVNPPGWYYYKSSIQDEADEEAVRQLIIKVLGEGPFVVPTDLCSPKYAHKQHEKVEPYSKLSTRWGDC